MNKLTSIIMKQDNPFYKSAVIAQSRIHPTDRMDNISRPSVRVNVKRRHSLGTVGDLYKKFGQKRRTG